MWPRFSDVVDFIGLLLLVRVFELAVCVSCVKVRRVFGHLCPCAGYLVDPAPEAAHSSVERGRGGVAAAVTPGDDPGQDPAARLVLTHQPAPGVALTTVAVEEAGVWRTAGAHGTVAGEAVAIALLALP